MTKSEVIGYYKGFKLYKSEYREERHPQYNYLGYSAICGEYYIQVKYADLEIRTSQIEILLLKFIQHLDRFIFENINSITNEVH